MIRKELAKAAGCRKSTVDFYASIGLIKPVMVVSRIGFYSENTVDRIKEIMSFTRRGKRIEDWMKTLPDRFEKESLRF